MKKPRRYLFFSFCFLLILSACRKEEERTPEQQERDQIMEVEATLRDHDWGFRDLIVTVTYESRAIPLLAGVADATGMVQPGVYDSYDIFGNGKRQLTHTYQFTRDDILLDTASGNEFNRVGGYYVIDLEKVRINPDSMNAVKFDYQLHKESGIFELTAGSLQRNRMNDALNNWITAAILSGRPDDISQFVVDGLLNNEKVALAIERFLFEMIHGKIEGITQSPDEAARQLAAILMEKIGNLDWELILYDQILEFLQKLELENPETRADELSLQFADRIATVVTEDRLYENLLPVVIEFGTSTLPVLVSAIAEKTYDLLSEVFSEDNVYDKVLPLWQSVVEADSSTVREVSDTLALAVSSRFMDKDSLAVQLLPFVTRLDETKTIKLGDLAQEIIDSVLIPRVDLINATFPALGLEPDWLSVKPVITSILTAIKAAIGTSTAEEFAENMAAGIVSMMELIIRHGFEKAIFRMQEIPPEQAASVISAWISSLVGSAQQEVVDFVEGKLNQILQRFEADQLTRTLAEEIHWRFLEVFSQENIYLLLYPVLETWSEADLEKVAGIMTDWIVETFAESDLPGKEEIESGIGAILETLIGSVNPEKVSEQLVQLILESDIIQGIDGDLLSVILKFKLYELLLETARDLNSIESIVITLQQK